MNNGDFGKRMLIKDEARKLFFQFGLSKTSMDDIARQSHLAKPTLYYYFHNKEAIFNEIVVDEARNFMDRVEKKIPEELTADQKIVFFLRTLHTDLKKYVQELTMLPDALYEQYPHGRPIVNKINEFFREKLRPLLENGREQQILEFEDLDITLTALTLMTDFLNLQWMKRYPEDERDKIVESVLNILLNGIRRNHKDAG